ncbi:MAG TPA: metallophosphoesterase [Acidimicrobiales bacterium]|nr:metallophosphoesterase [Acidimicrobiales bacterium]
MSGFDVIGDIHGCADKLTGLLVQLGYRNRDGAFRHSERQAIFVGDLIDRGDKQVETVRIVRSMIDAGTAMATMGNHEFNAISYRTPNPEAPGDFMRTHRGEKGKKNESQHAAFLEQVVEGSTLHSECLDWFRTLPLWLELDGIRIAHACWHGASISVISGFLAEDATISEAVVIEANTQTSPLYQAVETVLKGPEVALGEQFVFVDKDSHHRSDARIRWWDGHATTLRALAEIPAGSRTPTGVAFLDLPETPCPGAEMYRYTDITPVFFGHYWRTGAPTIAGPKAVCVDYSAVNGGPLVAYRWDGEDVPINANFRAFPDELPA